MSRRDSGEAKAYFAIVSAADQMATVYQGNGKQAAVAGRFQHEGCREVQGATCGNHSASVIRPESSRQASLPLRFSTHQQYQFEKQGRNNPYLGKYREESVWSKSVAGWCQHLPTMAPGTPETTEMEEDFDSNGCSKETISADLIAQAQQASRIRYAAWLTSEPVTTTA
jgi:hypothetical protein